MGADGRALAEFDMAYPRLLSAATRVVQNFFRYDRSRVEDVLAETMARTYERWERVRRHENPAGWVVVCAKHVCLEQVRADARLARGSSRARDGVDGSIDHAENTAVSAMVWNALEQLSKRQRDVAVLRYLMDCDEATTAVALGTTTSKVRTAAHEARGRLRALLADVYLDVGEVSA